MSETKLKLRDLGTIHLMALDMPDLLLPFGRPIADYLRGEAGNRNGSKALLIQRAADFEPPVHWQESLTALLRTTGFDELTKEEPEVSSTAPAEAPDPGVADFLSFEPPEMILRDPDPAIISPATAFEHLPVTLPRVATLPLRLRMTFGPSPQKVKPAPTAKPASPAPAAKSGPAIVPAPPKPAPVAPPKPATPPPAAKVSAPTPVPAKPSTPIPPPPKPGMTGAPPKRVTVLQPPAAPTLKTPVNPRTSAPAARAPEPNPAQVKSSSTPLRTPISPAGRILENLVPALDPEALTKPSPVPSKTSKAPAAVTSSKPLAPPLPVERESAPTDLMEQAPAHEVISRETAREKESQPRPRAKGILSLTESAPPTEKAAEVAFGPNLGAADSSGLLERIPMIVKIGVALLAIAVALYFGFGKSGGKPVEGNRAVLVGEQGWATEWASDTVGSRRARQLTLYRPSAGMTDYQFQFVGQVESKAVGWVFRALDTKNYYAMKVENLRPGAMALTHFAVVDGRESSYAQKPLTVDARPGATYRVKLDVTGPRFTVFIQGEPVDFWTDNRLKTGSVGLMNERDERGIASAVQFTFPQVSK